MVVYCLKKQTERLLYKKELVYWKLDVHVVKDIYSKLKLKNTTKT